MADLSHIYFTGGAPAAEAGVPEGTRPGSVAVPDPIRGAAGEIARNRFLDWLLERSGLNAGSFQPGVLERRAQACLRRLGVPSEAEARALLESHPDLLRSVLDVALIGVSSFFRDGAVFSALAQEIGRMVPPGGRGPRVLSAGSAEGQELYSVAMILEETGLGQGCDLVGVDVRTTAVERAREGRFREAQLEGLSAERRTRHFRKDRAGHVVRLPLRERTRWKAADLFAYREDRPFDVVLCRNVAIYLTPEGAGALWGALAGQVTPGGLLVTGKAERLPVPSGFEPLSPCIYRKTA